MNGAGCNGNGGEFPVVPLTEAKFDLGKGLPFSHANESASAGYYQVKLDSNVNVELTATARTGFGRFTYPADGKAYLMIDPTRTNTRRSASGNITAVNGSTRAVTGTTQAGNFCAMNRIYDNPQAYIYAEFNRDFTLTKVNGKTALEFKTEPGKETPVMMKIGVSFVSQENAKLNVDAESVKDWSFETAHQVAKAVWNKKLGAIKVDFAAATGKDKEYFTEHKKRLYTFLYRSLLAPNVASDVNGEYMSFKHEVSKTREGQVYYANYSAWDTYRSLAPFQALFFPKEAGDVAQSLVDVGKVCGAIPRWSNNDYEMGVMPGDSGPIIVAQTYAFGARNFDTASAHELMLNAADNPTTNCQGNYINWGRTRNTFTATPYPKAGGRPRRPLNMPMAILPWAILRSCSATMRMATA